MPPWPRRSPRPTRTSPRWWTSSIGRASRARSRGSCPWRSSRVEARPGTLHPSQAGRAPRRTCGRLSGFFLRLQGRVEDLVDGLDEAELQAAADAVRNVMQVLLVLGGQDD